MVMNTFNRFITSKINEESAKTSLAVYSSLTVDQKLAALNFMKALGAFCDGSEVQISRINNIMTNASKDFGISLGRYNLSSQKYDTLKSMTDVLNTISDQAAMDSLLILFFRVIAVTKSSKGASVLFKIFEQFGYSESRCFSLLENVKL